MLSKRIKVLISAIDLVDGVLPYQWALLKTYADKPELSGRIEWLSPIGISLREAKNALKRSGEFAKRHRIASVDVLGLSCYTWNIEQQIRIAELAKARNPDVLVVAGGPQLSHCDPDIFRKYPSVDVIVKKDGEIPFARILQAKVAGKTELSSIPGLILNQGGAARDTGPAETLSKFERSPWLENREFLEDWAANRIPPGVPRRAIFETNRGCPYACSFCNWGSNTESKIRSFDLGNLHEEISWLSSLEIDEIIVADGNFGIIPRDIEITQAFVSRMGARKRRKKPRIYFFAAKNNVDRVTQIAIELHRAGLLSSFNFGIQTTSPAALTAIGRTSLSLEKQRQMLNHVHAAGVPVEVNLVLGCPGETLASWRKSVTDAFEMGTSFKEFAVHRFELLANSPADHPEYRKKWEIQTVRRMSLHYDVSSVATYICSTRTFSRNDYVEMDVYSRVAMSVMQLPALKSMAARIHSTGESYFEIFNALVDDFFGSPEYTVANRLIERLRAHSRLFVECGDSVEEFPYIVDSDLGAAMVYHPNKYLATRIRERYREFSAELSRFISRRYGMSSMPRMHGFRRVERISGCV